MRAVRPGVLLAQAVVGGVMSLVLAGAALAQGAATEPAVRRDTLPNGLTIVVIENHAVPLATVHMVFRGGAMTQTDATAGVPHLFEHMLFKAYGSGEEDSFGDAASRLEAQFNGATSDEEVSYTLWLPSREIGGAIGLMADLVRDPAFTDRNLQLERFVVRNEMQRNQSQPAYLLDETTRRGLWGSWFSRKNPIGDDLSLFSVTAAKLKEIYDTWYVPNNAVLVVTGDVSAEKVLNEARKAFGRWKRRADPVVTFAVPAPPPLDSTIAFVYTHEVQTVTVNVSWRGPAMARDASETREALTLADLLNADDSPFQQQLVDNGLFQSAAMSADINQHGSELRFSGITTLAKLTDALGALGTSVGMLGTEGYFSDAMLEADARRDRTALAIEFEETSGLAYTVGSAWAARRLDTYLGTGDATQRPTVTPASLQAFSQKWLSPSQPYVIGVLTPPSTETAVSNTVAQYIAFMKP